MLHYVLCLLVYCYPYLGHVEIYTKTGNLKGKWMVSRNEKNYLAFEGIPYAHPPVGHLRFMDPVPIEKWNGVWDATHPGDPCVQWNYLENGPTEGSEDCLHLSVYTPAPLKKPIYTGLFKNWKKIKYIKDKLALKNKKLLPVMVYIHGGCFEFGSGESPREGADYFMDEPVVLVKINYRLGALGFLSFEEKELSGNFGLKDQAVALKWLQDNIIYFGGDPRRITLFGENAGAASINFHLLSPYSRGLFHKAIASSGSGYSPWALAKNGRARSTAIRTAHLVGCLRNTTREMVGCLRSVDAYYLVDQRRTMITSYVDPVCLYVPVIDHGANHPFLPNSLSKLQPAKVPVLFGINSADGLLKTSFYTKYGQFDWTSIDYHFTHYFKEILLLNPEIIGIEEEIAEIRQFYFGFDELGEYSFHNLTNLFTDGWFYLPMIQAFRNHPETVYLYYLDYLGENSYADVYGSRRIIDGACHRDETIYLFNSTKYPKFHQLSSNDEHFSKQLVRTWADFARFGDPVKSQGLNIGDWRHRDYLEIGNLGFLIKKDLLQDVIKFWFRLTMMT
nr:esterase E4 [Halyomorpha halys]